MLVTLKNILKIAEANQAAIGSFNTPNLESINAVIGAAEELDKPVIIMHAQVHEAMGLAKIDEIGPIMLMLAQKAKVPVCVHLDHGMSLEYLKKALDIGFTSIMYDGSDLPLLNNYANTSIVVEIAAGYGASVEAEVGSMGSRESGENTGESVYTEPELAKDFVEKTGIDALACAFGTAHGIYQKAPKLDFDRVAKIHSMVKVPLVMHGGSGVSAQDYLKVIDCGIRKINYYTYMSKAGREAVEKAKDLVFFHDEAAMATQAMKEDVLKAIQIFSKENRTL